ncbi:MULTISPECIES: hypothetical protein [unclassified Aureimonas]|uniref:hypothetical protein n=1 Tax=unclassified Aureimonas TaxID=2615206 RepID=UPI000700AE54|nr:MULTISPECIES: hypothetical protein [unclassified Aureimonas]KQT69853.1 hypothetical protein ASG62_01735 [Aureimonas sp. Leaf427]KQT75995.1 hypothetical protein ASG54_14485 [Aureimonas sp. Leaf460]
MRPAAFLLATVFALFGWISSAAAQGTVRQVYLVQNSGWMEPFYKDETSQFLNLVTHLVRSSELTGVPITIASFNQDGQIEGRRSPDVVFEGAVSDAAFEAVSRIDVPRRANGRYADADFLGALKSTLGTILQGQEGVIWMVTNNKNSPDNSQNVMENTRGFYDLLRQSDFITRIVSFPLRMRVVGPNFSENGFIIYAIAYGETAARALDVVIAPGTPIRSLFADPPVSLKPVAPEAVELILDAQSLGDGVTARMQDGIVVVDDLAAEAGRVLTVRGQVRNVAYPKKIVSATVTTRWDSGAAENGPQASADPPQIQDLAAGAISAPVALTLSLPPFERPPGLAGLFETEAVIDGRLRIALNDLSYDLDDAFVEKAAAVFGGSLLGDGQRQLVEEQLPRIFFDYEAIDSAVTDVPMRLVVRFSSLPLYLAAGALLALLAAVGALVWLATRARTYTVAAGGSSHRLLLRSGQAVTVEGLDGSRHRVTGRLFGAPSIHPST